MSTTNDCLNAFAHTTTFHGVAQISRSKSNCSKMTWIILLVVVTLITFYQITVVFKVSLDYINTPSAVAVATKVKDNLELPGIVICPLRGLNASRLVEDGLPLYLVDIIMSRFAAPMRWKNLVTKTPQLDLDLANVELKNFMFTRNQSEFADFLLMYSYEPQEFVHSLFRNDFGIFDERHNFTKIVQGYDGGICFAYQSNDTCTWPSILSGYQLVLKLAPKNKFDSVSEDGWTIGVASQVSMAPPNFIKIMQNCAVDIKLNAVSYQRLFSMDWPKNGHLCDSSATIASTSDCFGLAYAAALKNVCKCASFQKPNLWRNQSVTTCTPMDQDLCLSIPRDSDNVQIKTLEAQNVCIPVCEETIYETSVTYSQLDRASTNSKFQIPQSYDVSFVRISFTKMEETYYTSYETTTFSTLIGNLGGQLGLWLGASVISLIHLLVWLPEYCVAYRKAKQNAVDNVTNVNFQQKS